MAVAHSNWHSNALINKEINNTVKEVTAKVTVKQPWYPISLAANLQNPLYNNHRPGFAYQKAVVALMDLSDAGAIQFNLFSTHHDNSRLMQVMDRINSVWGRGTLRSAAEGVRKEWSMKRERKSPNYTTRWDELPEAR